MCISYGEKSCGDGCSGKEHASCSSWTSSVLPTQVTGGEVTLIPCRWLKFTLLSPFCKNITPLVKSSAFAVVFSQTNFRIRCPFLIHAGNVYYLRYFFPFQLSLWKCFEYKGCTNG